MLSVLRTEPGADLDMHLNEGKEWSEDQAVEVALNISGSCWVDPRLGRVTLKQYVYREMT
jgi:hypothetical protein